VQQPIYAYLLAPQDLNPGDTVQSGANAPIKPGNTMPLKDIPVGMPINSIELHPNKGGQLCRAAGCMATIVNKQQEHAIVRLPSGEETLVVEVS
jgi:large subunit ribosomal protein L2